MGLRENPTGVIAHVNHKERLIFMLTSHTTLQSSQLYLPSFLEHKQRRIYVKALSRRPDEVVL